MGRDATLLVVGAQAVLLVIKRLQSQALAAKCPHEDGEAAQVAADAEAAVVDEDAPARQGPPAGNGICMMFKSTRNRPQVGRVH